MLKSQLVIQARHESKASESWAPPAPGAVVPSDPSNSVVQDRGEGRHATQCVGTMVGCCLFMRFVNS